MNVNTSLFVACATRHASTPSDLRLDVTGISVQPRSSGVVQGEWRGLRESFYRWTIEAWATTSTWTLFSTGLFHAIFLWILWALLSLVALPCFMWLLAKEVKRGKKGGRPLLSTFWQKYRPTYQARIAYLSSSVIRVLARACTAVRAATGNNRRARRAAPFEWAYEREGNDVEKSREKCEEYYGVRSLWPPKQ